MVKYFGSLGWISDDKISFVSKDKAKEWVYLIKEGVVELLEKTP